MYTFNTLENITFIIVTFFVTINANTVSQDTCNIPTIFNEQRSFGQVCDFKKISHSQIRFGDMDGNILSTTRFHLDSNIHINCINKGKWLKGTRYNGEPTRNPCEYFLTTQTPDIWISEISPDPINNQITYKYTVNDMSERLIMKNIFFTKNLRCHPDNPSLILITGNDGSVYCDEKHTEPCLLVDLEIEFTPTGSDTTFIQIILICIFVIFMTIINVACNTTGQDFFLGYFIGSVFGDSYNYGGNNLFCGFGSK